jgi:hypothetical protein
MFATIIFKVFVVRSCKYNDNKLIAKIVIWPKRFFYRWDLPPAAGYSYGFYSVYDGGLVGGEDAGFSPLDQLYC